MNLNLMGLDHHFVYFSPHPDPLPEGEGENPPSIGSCGLDHRLGLSGKNCERVKRWERLAAAI